MTWYELLLTLHILAAGLWFGSAVTLNVISYRLFATDPPAFGGFMALAGRWASIAHPASAVVILLVGLGMVADADLSMGELWISLGLAGWLVLLALGGALIGPAGTRLTAAYERSGGVVDETVRATAGRLLLLMRIESAILVLVIADMVVKPG